MSIHDTTLHYTTIHTTSLLSLAPPPLRRPHTRHPSSTGWFISRSAPTPKPTPSRLGKQKAAGINLPSTWDDLDFRLSESFPRPTQHRFYYTVLAFGRLACVGIQPVRRLVACLVLLGVRLWRDAASLAPHDLACAALSCMHEQRLNLRRHLQQTAFPSTASCTYPS